MFSQFNIKIIYLFFFVSLFTFISCKKYPEDDKRSWQSFTKRINKTWYLKECFIDGKDSTYRNFRAIVNSNDTIFWSLKNISLNFTNKQIDYLDNNYGLYYSVPDLYFSSGKVNDYISKLAPLRYDSKSRFKIDLNRTSSLLSNYNVCLLRSNEKWDIKKLTDKEFIIESINSQNKLIRLKFNSN